MAEGKVILEQDIDIRMKEYTIKDLKQQIAAAEAEKEGGTRPSSPSVTSNKNTFTSPAPDKVCPTDGVITFGKYNGKTIREVFKQDRQYAEWLLNNERTEEGIKYAIVSLLEQAAAESEHLMLNKLYTQNRSDDKCSPTLDTRCDCLGVVIKEEDNE